MIRVLVIDESPLGQKVVGDMLSADPEISVVGKTVAGESAIRRLREDVPDVVVATFNDRQVKASSVLRRIVEEGATPFVILTPRSEPRLRLPSGGVVDVVEFAANLGVGADDAFAGLQRELASKVKVAARVRPSRPDGEKEEDEDARRVVKAKNVPDGASAAAPIDLIAIGSSTGGVPGVSRILKQLTAESPPIVVVQHMPKAFTGTFAKRLDNAVPVDVREAQGGERLRRGLALIAPGDAHLEILRQGTAFVAIVGPGPKVCGHRPSVDVLFESCARVNGDGCLGVILTGMGKDGAAGLLAIRQRAGRTIAESEESCVIYGMPKEAIERGGAEFVLPNDEIADKVVDLLRAGDGVRTPKAVGGAR